MCGRFTITHPNEAIAALFDALPGNDLPPVPRFNICPTQPVKQRALFRQAARQAANAIGQIFS